MAFDGMKRHNRADKPEGWPRAVKVGKHRRQGLPPPPFRGGQSFEVADYSAGRRCLRSFSSAEGRPCAAQKPGPVAGRRQVSRGEGERARLGRLRPGR